MSTSQLEAAARRLGDVLSESHCLCVGSGATVRYVGTWNALLGRMLGRKFTHSWLDAGNPYSAISRYSDWDCFRGFFTEEGSLELGEFLLADMALAKPREYAGDDIEWKERLFSRMVSDVIRENMERRLGECCAGEQAKKCAGARAGGAPGDCPLAREGSHSLADAFAAYGRFGELGRAGDARAGCMLANGIDTTMAVVELCATGKIRYVIDYNFDLIIEDALRQVIDAGGAASPIEEIHVWTYGAACETTTLAASDGGAKCPVVFHRGYGQDDFQTVGKDATIHFFHVHGVASGLSFGGITSNLVLSQHSYDAYQDSPLNWSNRVLEYLLSRHGVVGVGFSGIDANFRHFARMHAGLSSRHGASEAVRDLPSAGKEMVLLKARRPYRDAIERSIGEAKLPSDPNDEFLRYCTDMVRNYYAGYYRIGTEWVDEYADVAEVVHLVATG